MYSREIIGVSGLLMLSFGNVVFCVSMLSCDTRYS